MSVAVETIAAGMGGGAVEVLAADALELVLFPELEVAAAAAIGSTSLYGGTASIVSVVLTLAFEAVRPVTPAALVVVGVVTLVMRITSS